MPKITSKDGTIIAYDKKGQGPLLILVLGALNKRGSGKKLAERLKDNFTVVCYDRRGRGDSTEELPYSVNKEVEDLTALIDELGGKAGIYGHSSGAILGLLAAEKLGKKVTGLAIYEVPYNSDPNALKDADEYRKELASLIANDKRGQAVTLFIKSVGVSDKQISALRRLPMWKGLTAIAQTLAYDTIELVKKYPTIDIGKVRTPTLVMYGANSPGFMGDTAKRLSNSLPKARLYPLEGQTHDVKVDALAPVLADFFQN